MSLNSIQMNYIVAKSAKDLMLERSKKKYDHEYASNTWNAFKVAEKELVEFGVALAPEDIRETLAHGVNTYFSQRDKLINLVLRLDVNTIPESVKFSGF